MQIVKKLVPSISGIVGSTFVHLRLMCPTGGSHHFREREREILHLIFRPGWGWKWDGLTIEPLDIIELHNLVIVLCPPPLSLPFVKHLSARKTEQSKFQHSLSLLGTLHSQTFAPSLGKTLIIRTLRFQMSVRIPQSQLRKKGGMIMPKNWIVYSSWVFFFFCYNGDSRTHVCPLFS